MACFDKQTKNKWINKKREKAENFPFVITIISDTKEKTLLKSN